jgi:hypothetical protein
MKGPVFADHTTARREDADALWSGKRPLRVTIAADAGAPDRELVGRLEALGRTDDVIVYTGPEYQPVDDSAPMTRPTWDRIDTGEDFAGNAVIQDENHHSLHGLGLQKDWRQLAVQFLGEGIADGEAQAVYLELSAHEAFKNDVFVTRNAVLLGKRFGTAWYSTAGIFSPREAVTTVEMFLRSRETIIPILGKPVSLHMEPVSFYRNLTEAKIPVVLRALRSCLSPSYRDSRRQAAAHIEGVATRYHALLEACDSLHRQAVVEGHMYGNNLVLLRVLYHLQYAVVLVTGALDNLAWFLADLEGVTPERYQVSWQALTARRERKWVEGLQTDAARSVRDAVRTHASLGTMDLVYDLRDAVQHRQPFKAGVTDVMDAPMVVGRPDGPIRARMVMLHLRKSLAPVDYDVPVGLAGAFRFGEDDYLMPYPFIRGVLDTLASLLNDALGTCDWPNAEGWWEPPMDPWVQREEIIRLAGWLFG